jgi:hypothetical protein
MMSKAPKAKYIKENPKIKKQISKSSICNQ